MAGIEQIDLTGMKVPTVSQSVDMGSHEIDTTDLVFGKNNTADMLKLLAHKKINTKNLGVHTSKIKVSDQNGEMVVEFPDENGKILTAMPNKWALSQVVKGTMGDKQYYDKCKKNGPEGLAELNVNSWLENKNSMQIIRTMNGTMRAFLGQDYMIVDSYDALDEISKQISAANAQRIADGIPPLKIDRGSMSEGHLYIEVLDESHQYDIGKGDMYNGMISFENSDVGGGAMNADVGFFRWACANLHIKNQVMHKIHRDKTLDVAIVGKVIVSQMALLWIQAIGKTIDHVTRNGQLFDQWATELRESKEIKITNTETTLKNLKSELTMNDNEIALITARLMGDQTIQPEDRMSGYALVQAVTGIKPGVDREHELAAAAGRLTANGNKQLAMVVA